MVAVAKGPKTRLVYFAVLWLCGELAGAAEDRLQPQPGGGGNVCCSGGAPTPCPNDSASCKKCGPGKACSNQQCNECRTVPKCKEGEELQCSGTIDFNFFCKECPYGTFLDGKTGCCIAWADCSRNGLQTVQPGNRTHNVQCGIVLSTVEADSMFTNVMAIVTAAGIFLIFLMMIFLLFLMWMQKREKLPEAEGLEAANDSNPVQLPQQHEDSFSCQYPEEERGHKVAEERDSMPFLAH